MTAIASKPTTRRSTARKSWHTGRSAIHLTIIWYELWMPTLAAGTLTAAGINPYVIAVLYLALLAKLRHQIAKNITDTIAISIRRRWNTQRADGIDLPALVDVHVSGLMAPHRAYTTLKTEGRGAVLADKVELTIRPNGHQGDQSWTDAFTTWCRRRYGFQTVDCLPSLDSSNLIVVHLGQHKLPGIVEAAE